MAVTLLTNVSQLATTAGVENDLAIVTQVYIGGTFVYRQDTAGIYTPDGGTVSLSAGSGKWVRQDREFGLPFNVWWFGAVPDGAVDYATTSVTGTDNTNAFNAATLAAQAYDPAGLNTKVMKRDIYIPAGNYRINGTVYVRKGQHLRGAGYGATRIMNTSASTERGLIVMGEGLGLGQDKTIPGDPNSIVGTPTQLSNLMIDGTATGRTAIRCDSTPGSLITDVWILNCAKAFELGGSDVIVNNCVVDQCIELGSIGGNSQLITNSIFFRVGLGFTLSPGNYAAHGVILSNCRFEYYREAGDPGMSTADRYMIKIPHGDRVCSIIIDNCQFDLYNANPSSLAMIRIECHYASDIVIRNCMFNNPEGYCIAVAGFSNEVFIENCSFNKKRAHDAYTSSSNPLGIYCRSVVDSGAQEFGGAACYIRNCRFIDLNGAGITVDGTGKFRLVATNNIYERLNSSAGIAIITNPPNSFVVSMNNIYYSGLTSISGGASVNKNITNDVYYP